MIQRGFSQGQSKRPDEYDRWDDLRFPANFIDPGVANAPDWVVIKSGSYGTLYVAEFDKNTEEECYVFAQLPHSWRLGTNIRPHIHWVNHNDTTGNVVWGLEYSIADVNGYFPSTPTTQTITVACAANIDGEIKHQINSFAEIDMSGFSGVSCMLIMRLYRDADNASDTADNDVGLLEFDIHYLKDSAGSKSEFTK